MIQIVLIIWIHIAAVICLCFVLFGWLSLFCAVRVFYLALCCSDDFLLRMLCFLHVLNYQYFFLLQKNLKKVSIPIRKARLHRTISQNSAVAFMILSRLKWKRVVRLRKNWSFMGSSGKTLLIGGHKYKCLIRRCVLCAAYDCMISS